MSEIAIVQATFADRAEAERIGALLVGERLAACVNILAPCTSIYRWQDKVEHAAEVPALFKTQPERAARLHQRLTELHSYDQPAIETWPARVADTLAEWVRYATT